MKQELRDKLGRWTVGDISVPELDDHLAAAYRKDADTDVVGRLDYLKRSHPEVDLDLTPPGMPEKNMVGYVRFHRKPTGQYFAADSYVHPDYRRQGVATALYQHSQKRISIVPSAALSPDAKKFWTSDPLDKKHPILGRHGK